MQLIDVLVGGSNREIGEAIDRSYTEIVRHYVLRNWKTAGVDAGHFVEASRRFVELRLFGRSTPIGRSLPAFTVDELRRYEQATGDESYRILIPRMLWALYALRNKRSIGHLGAVPATEIDATALLYGAKWVISELVRLNSTGTSDDTRALVHRIVERQEAAVWREDDVIRVLDAKMQARDKTLVILALTGDKSEDKLRGHVQYSNPTNYRKILKRLDAQSLILYEPGRCRISPTGVLEAEKILEQRGLVPS